MPVVALPRNSQEGATWYPLTGPMPSVSYCQHLVEFADADTFEGVNEVPGTGQNILSKNGTDTLENWLTFMGQFRVVGADAVSKLFFSEVYNLTAII